VKLNVSKSSCLTLLLPKLELRRAWILARNSHLSVRVYMGRHPAGTRTTIFEQLASRPIIDSVSLLPEEWQLLTMSTPTKMTTPPDPDPPFRRTRETIELYAWV
jgi:hypothetical protein